MDFNKLVDLMAERNITTLAEIARSLNVTPQVVSNWKSRNQVPYHILARINNLKESPQYQNQTNQYENDVLKFSDILLTVAEQLKVIVLITFITVFITFTYIQLIQEPQYLSWSTILLPDNKTSANLGGLVGIASQFGVNIPSNAQADLSSPILFPELLRSRTFAEKILDKNFYTKKFDKKLTLLAILTHGDEKTKLGRDILINQSMSRLSEIMEFEQDPLNSISTLKITINEASLSKDLADTVLYELESLNRYFKNQSVSQKIKFIEQRIKSVSGELIFSEQKLKSFNEQNRQSTSPALKLSLDRLTRDLEVQEGIYLTLKQQLELAKIEEIQEASIVQVLDKPQLPLFPSNKNIKFSIILATIIGLGLGTILGFIRSYFNTGDSLERSKIRRTRNFFKKKSKDLILDKRIFATVSILMLLGLPFYLSHKSNNPVFFGMYSLKFMLFNSTYIIFLLFSIVMFFKANQVSKK